MPPILGIPSSDKWRTRLPSAFQLRFRAAITHRRRYQGAHMEGVSQVQPWSNPLNSSHVNKSKQGLHIYPLHEEGNKNFKWPPLIISSRGLSMMTPWRRKHWTFVKQEAWSIICSGKSWQLIIRILLGCIYLLWFVCFKKSRARHCPWTGLRYYDLHTEQTVVAMFVLCSKIAWYNVYTLQAVVAHVLKSHSNFAPFSGHHKNIPHATSCSSKQEHDTSL